MKKLSREQMRNVMGGNYQPICLIICCMDPDPNGGCRNHPGTNTPNAYSVSSTTCDPQFVASQCVSGLPSCSCGNGPGY